ncbi:MAG: F0F1 ATP synthase subunit B [Bacteroidales bacterium]|nr:F0F1 ATP synthase subunit B [Bacteroidales bacterium]
MELVTPGLGLIFWMTISFGILLFILGKFAWKPVMKMIKEREESIENSLRAADKAIEDIGKLKISNEELLREAKNEKDQILKEARKIKESIIEEAKTKAVDEANRILEQARENMNNEKMAVITELKNQIATLSIEIAEKIMREELSKDEKQKTFINKLVDEAKLN